MRLCRNRWLLFGGIIYLIYLTGYDLLKKPLPGHIEIRAWVSIVLLMLAVVGGMLWVLSLIQVLTRKVKGNGWKRRVVKVMAIICSIVVVGVAAVSGRILVSEIPDETMSTDGTLLVSVQESKDSMRLYYCEEVNAFLRKRLSAEEFRKTQR